MSKKKSLSPFVYSTDPEFIKKQESRTEAASATSPGDVTPLVSLDTKHRGGKTVTVISKLGGDEQALENIAKKIKVYCGAGGSVKDAEVIIQGDHREKVLQWLLKNGYSKAKRR